MAKIKTAMDGAVYTRSQTGHSIIVWLILCAFVIPIPIFIYYIFSPRHYFHL